MAVSDYQQVFYFSDFMMISVTHQEEEETSHPGEFDTGVIYAYMHPNFRWVFSEIVSHIHHIM